MTEQTYVCASGKEVRFVGLSPFEIDEVKALVPLPEVPTRQIQTAVADYQEVEALSADDLRDEDERQRWAAYETELAAAKAERDRLLMNFLLTEGIEFDLEGMEAWEQKRRRWNLPVPANEQELKATYVKTAIIGSVADLDAIIQGVMRKQGLDEATLKSVQATFQRAIRRDTPIEPEAAG